MITLTINSATLTSKEAGAAAAMLLALHPDCLADAIGTLDPDQLRLPFVHHEGAADVIVPDAATAFASAPAPEQTAAEAFAAPGTQPPEAGAPFVSPGPVAAPPAAPAPVAAGAAAPESSAGASDGPAAPVTAPAAAVELDSEGLPWDARIHSSPASLTKKGPWRAKRNLNQLTEQKVKEELRAAMAAQPASAATAAPAPAPAETPAERTAREAVEQGLVSAPLAPAPVTPTPPAAPVPVAATPAPPPPTVASAPAVSTPSPAPAAASPAPSPAADDATPPATLFAAAMRKVTKAQLDGHITVPETDAILTHLGLAQMRDLLARPDLIPVFDVSVDNHVARFVTQ